MPDFWMMDRLREGTCLSAYGGPCPVDPGKHPGSFTRYGAIRPGTPENRENRRNAWLSEIGNVPFDGSEFDAHLTHEAAYERICTLLPERSVWVTAHHPNDVQIIYRWNYLGDEIDRIDSDVIDAVTADHRLLHPAASGRLSRKVESVATTPVDIDITLARLRRRGLVP